MSTNFGNPAHDHRFLRGPRVLYASWRRGLITVLNRSGVLRAFPSPVAAAAVIALAGGAQAQAPTSTSVVTQPASVASPVVEHGRLFVYRRQNLIGTERYEVERRGDTVVMRATHDFSDRTRPTSEVTAELRLGTRLTPMSYQLHGDRELSVDVEHGKAVIRDEGGTRQQPVNGGFFTTVGPAPYAVPMMLVRYWLAHGRPDTIPLLPYGQAAVRLLGRDTLQYPRGAPMVLDRYIIRGLDDLWGGLTLWLDGEQALMAAIGGNSREAVRERFQAAMPFFIRRSVNDAVSGAETLSRSIASEHSGTFALVGGTIIDGRGGPAVRDAIIVVRAGRIVAAGPRATTRIPSDAARVDATGMSILPGLWDMHSHLNKTPDYLVTYLAAGVTTVRDMGSEMEWSAAFRDAVARGRVLGPRLLLAGMIDGRAPGANGLVQVATPEEARQAVRRYHTAGYQQIKIYSVLSPELVPVITAEAHRLGMPVVGHVPYGMTAVEAVEAGMDQVSHLWAVFNTLLPDGVRGANSQARYAASLSVDLSGKTARTLIETLRRHGTVIDATLAQERGEVAPLTVATEPGLQHLPPELQHSTVRKSSAPPPDPLRADVYRTKVLELMRLLHRAGVPVVAGTDWEDLPGHALHRELETLVEAGMTPMEAIQSATIVPARVMRLDRELGTIAVGKRADMVVIDGDPLRSIREIRNVRAVITGGRMYGARSLWRRIGVPP